MTRTFIDSGVLIAASRGNTICSFAVLGILNDREREFASSAFIKTEKTTKPMHRVTEIRLVSIASE